MPSDPRLIPEVLKRWARDQKRKLLQAFDVGGHQLHGGDRWVPLDPETGFGTPLKDSGNLMRATFVKVSGLSVLVGNRSNIAIYHQNGTKSIPKRPVVVVTRQDLNELKRDLKRTLES